jgi:uncharacterized protein (DUF2236 family)
MVTQPRAAGMVTGTAEVKRSRAVERRPIAPDTRAWDEMGLISFTLSAGSAFLLQTMEPSIAAVVDEHSTFRTDPFGRAFRSIASVMTWIYGGEEALAEADRLREMHARLNSVDAHGVRHTALSSAPWAWVMQTGVYSMVESSKYFSRRPLTPADKEVLYQESTQVWRNLGVIEKEIPPTYPELVAHVEKVVDERLYASTVSRDFLAVTRKAPPPSWLPRLASPLWRLALTPIGGVQYFVLIGTLPEGARRKLGINWTARDEVLLRVLGKAVAYTVPLLPERLRYFPIAYEARKLERSRQRLRKVLELRPM